MESCRLPFKLLGLHPPPRREFAAHSLDELKVAHRAEKVVERDQVADLHFGLAEPPIADGVGIAPDRFADHLVGEARVMARLQGLHLPLAKNFPVHGEVLGFWGQIFLHPFSPFSVVEMESRCATFSTCLSAART